MKTKINMKKEELVMRLEAIAQYVLHDTADTAELIAASARMIIDAIDQGGRGRGKPAKHIFRHYMGCKLEKNQNGWAWEHPLRENWVSDRYQSLSAVKQAIRAAICGVQS